VRKSFHNPVFDSQTVQPVANRYNAFAILAHGDIRINVTLWRVRGTTVAVQKQYVLHILNAYLYPWLSSKQCVCAVLYCPTVFFQNCLINGTIFGNNMPVWTSPQCLYKIFYILIRIQRNIITMYAGLQVKCPFLSSGFNKTLSFSPDFRKNAELNFMKILSVGVDLFHSDRRASGMEGQTDKHDETRVAYCNFSNAYKNLCQECYACKYLQVRSKQNVLNPPVPITSVVRLQMHIFWGVLLWTMLY
jgi:hypothetical protein